jgi:hypothetical protein
MAASQPRLSAKPSPRLPEVACLEEFWAAHTRGGLPLQEIVTKLLLDTLGLGNQEVFRFLYSGEVSFADFEDWIVETAGMPDPDLLSRYHGWLMDVPASDAAQARLASIAAMPPVLDAEQLAFWDEHGYVVVPQAIAPEEAAQLRALVWETIGGSPQDPTSWYVNRADGIMVPRFRHQAIDVARHSPRIHKAFAQLWGSEDLWVTIDRLGFNPPETASYRFEGSDIHWDVSLAQPVPFGTQGVLYLTDTTAEQGAFRCVPGFHRRIDAWLDALGQYLNYYSPDMRIDPRWR